LNSKIRDDGDKIDDLLFSKNILENDLISERKNNIQYFEENTKLNQHIEKINEYINQLKNEKNDLSNKIKEFEADLSSKQNLLLKIKYLKGELAFQERAKKK